MKVYKFRSAIPFGFQLLSTVAIAGTQAAVPKQDTPYASIVSKLPGTNFKQVLEEGGFTIRGNLKASFTSNKPFSDSVTSIAPVTLNLSGINLEFASVASQLATTHLKLNVDNSPEGKAQVTVDRAALLFFGKYENSIPYYMVSHGTLPFAKSDSKLLEGSIANTLGNTKARATTLGLIQKINDQAEVSIAAFAFNGKIIPTLDGKAGIRNGGISVQYRHEAEGEQHWTAEAEVGYLYNIADSNRMQSNGNSNKADNVFKGFESSNQVLEKAVGGASARASFSMGDFTVQGEYVTAVTAFKGEEDAGNKDRPVDMNIKEGTARRGAKPMAWHGEVAYKWKEVKEKLGAPSLPESMTFVIGYGGSKDALALLLPKHFVAGAIITQLSKETSIGIEYRHMFDYPNTVQSNGIKGTGGQSYLFKAQVGVSF